MQRFALAFLLGLTFAASLVSAPTPVPTLTLIPASGNVSGQPGGVVGWGFSVTYAATSDWLVLTQSQFTGSPVYGTYVDYLSQATAPLYVVGPSPESSTVQQSWNRSSNPMLGLGEFDIDSTAPAAATIAGNILLHYSVFSQDPNNPNFNPDTDTVVADTTVSAPAQVTVSPEPSSLSLVSTLFLLALAAKLWRERVSTYCRRIMH